MNETFILKIDTIKTENAELILELRRILKRHELKHNLIEKDFKNNETIITSYIPQTIEIYERKIK